MARGKVQAGMIATNMTSVANVPMFAGKELFIATPAAYAGHDRPELDLTRISEAQDPVVRQPGEERLARLERQAPRPCTRFGMSLILLPRSCGRADHVDAEEVEDRPSERDAPPAGRRSLTRRSPARRVVEREHGRRIGDDGLARRDQHPVPVGRASMGDAPLLAGRRRVPPARR